MTQNLIAGADSADELREPVLALLKKIDALPAREPYFWDRMLRRGADFYSKWATTKIFRWVASLCFMAIGIFVLFEIVEIVKSLVDHEHRTIHHWIVFIAYIVSMKSVLVGDIRFLRGKRLSAYRWFNEGLLVWLLVVQVFVFLRAPLKGIIFLFLFLLLLLLGAVRYMIAEEKSLAASVSSRLSKGNSKQINMLLSLVRLISVNCQQI